MVISRGQFLQGEFRAIFDEIASCKEACSEAHLKVILETGELTTYDNVRYASDLAMAAGADFIKTSTGKVPIAATLPVTLVMLQAIEDFYDRTGRMVGMKPAGGISSAKLAIENQIAKRKPTLVIESKNQHTTQCSLNLETRKTADLFTLTNYTKCVFKTELINGVNLH